MIKSLIIEDEPHGQELLQTLINTYCKKVDVLAVASNVKEGIEQIQKHKPDLVFMDYQIEGGNGFDVLNNIPNPSFKVIFITGYSEYAIKAFKYSALDYLLKPINIDELIEAVNRFDPEIQNYSKNYNLLNENIKDSELSPNQIIIPTKGEYKVVNIWEISFIKALQSYVEIQISNSIKIISSEPLKHYESFLSKTDFFKSHKSYIVNLRRVQSVDQGRGGMITLFSGHQVPIAARRKSLFLKQLKDLK